MSCCCQPPGQHIDDVLDAAVPRPGHRDPRRSDQADAHPGTPSGRDPAALAVLMIMSCSSWKDCGPALVIPQCRAGHAGAQPSAGPGPGPADARNAGNNGTGPAGAARAAKEPPDSGGSVRTPPAAAKTRQPTGSEGRNPDIYTAYSCLRPFPIIERTRWWSAGCHRTCVKRIRVECLSPGDRVPVCRGRNTNAPLRSQSRVRESKLSTGGSGADGDGHDRTRRCRMGLTSGVGRILTRVAEWGPAAGWGNHAVWGNRWLGRRRPASSLCPGALGGDGPLRDGMPHSHGNVASLWRGGPAWPGSFPDVEGRVGSRQRVLRVAVFDRVGVFGGDDAGFCRGVLI